MLRRVWLRVGPRAHSPTAESLAKPKALCCTTTWGYPTPFLSPSHAAALGLRKTALCARVAPGQVPLHLKLSSLPSVLSRELSSQGQGRTGRGALRVPAQPGVALPVPPTCAGGCMRVSAGRRQRSCCSSQATAAGPS